MTELENLEKLRKRREYYNKNKTRIAEQRKAWRKANPEKHREQKQRWRKKNKPKVREAKRRWYDKNKEKAYASYLRWKERNPVVYRDSIRRATRNYERRKAQLSKLLISASASAAIALISNATPPTIS